MRSQKGSIVQSALGVQEQWRKVVQDQKAGRNMQSLCVHILGEETDDRKRDTQTFVKKKETWTPLF